MDLKKLLKRAILSQKDPNTYKELTNAEIAALIAQLVNSLGSYKTELKSTIEGGKMKSDQEVQAMMGELKEKYRDVNLDELAGLREMVNQSIKESQAAQSVVSQLSNELRAKMATVRSGKDGRVTDKEIDKAAAMVVKGLPSMKSVLKEDPAFLRDILEELAEDDRLDIAAVRGAETILAKVDKMEDRVKRLMTPGAIIAARMDQIGDVDLTTAAATDGQVLAWDATNKKWAPSDAGAGDMTKAVYDPTTVEGDAFDMANMVEAADAKVLTAAERTAIAANTTHKTSNGSDHTFIDQDVTSGASPTFATTNMTEGTDKNFVTDAEATVIGNTSGTNTGDEAAADLTTAGVIEVATAAETTTGTDATRAVSPDGLAGSIHGKKTVQLTCVDYATDTAVGDGVGYFHVPAALAGFNIVAVHAEVITAGTTGTTDIQIHNVTAAADILSTKLTIDSGETGSDTAATPAVISATEDDLTENDLIRIDVDAVSTTAAKGLIVTLDCQLP